MKKSRTTLTHLPLCLGLIAIGAAPAIQAGETVPATASPSKQQHFSIRPQPLYSALSALASQTGVQFAYTAALVKGLVSQGVTGQHSTEQALRQILAGSGINFQFSNANTVTLKKAPTPVTATETHSETTLKAMTVVGEAVQDPNDPYAPDDKFPYQVETSTVGSKVPLEITQVPQSVQVITSKAFEDQGTFSIGNIMKQVASASIFGSRLSGFPKVNIRGFQTQQTRNGIRQLFASDTDFSALSHIQRVEVLKGPGSSTFGDGGDGGGIINVVTKRAYDALGAEVSFTRGGWTGFDGDITMGQFDFNSPLTSDGDLKARFTGEIEGSNTFINFQELNRQNFGLALTYDNGGPVRAFINAEYQHRQTFPNPGLPNRPEQ